MNSAIAVLLNTAGAVLSIWAAFTFGKAIWIRFHSGWPTAKTSGAGLRFAQEVVIAICLFVATTGCFIAAAVQSQ